MILVFTSLKLYLDVVALRNHGIKKLQFKIIDVLMCKSVI